MTREDIIRMAREAGMEQDLDMWFSPSYEQCDVHIVELERFAQLVAAAEREACAKYVEGLMVGNQPLTIVMGAIGDGIRERGKQ